MCNHRFNITIFISSAYDVRLLGEKKMRPIDADEVKKAFIGNRYGTKAIEYVIDNAPTVKAIPVEWIEKKLYCCDNINAEIFVKALIREWENNEWRQ